MDEKATRIVLQIVDAMLYLDEIICDLVHNDVVIIGAVRNPNLPKALVAAVESVSATGDAALSLNCRLRKLREAIQKN